MQAFGNGFHEKRDFPFSLNDFQAILKRYNSQATVGFSCKSTDCPIARAVVNRYHQKGYLAVVVSVGSHTTHVTAFGPGIQCESVVYDNPLWVREFIRRVDENYQSGPESITARLAQDLLVDLVVERMLGEMTDATNPQTSPLAGRSGLRKLQLVMRRGSRDAGRWRGAARRGIGDSRRSARLLRGRVRPAILRPVRQPALV